MNLCLRGQNTVGLLSHDIDQAANGYQLIYPDLQSTTYLLNPCGQIVHKWLDANDDRPGLAC